MKRKPIIRIMMVILIVALLSSDLAAILPTSRVRAVQAVGPGSNLILGLFRTIGALNRRNRIYREAGATAGEINAYYDGLIAKTREIRTDMIRKAAVGETSPVLVRSYVRIEAALEAERKAAVQMIEAEKNQARRDFNRNLVREITNILIASPGGQKILNDVQNTITKVREAAVAVQTAANEGKPFDLLANALAEQVGNIQIVKNAAYELGSAIGDKLDQAIDGVFSNIQGAMNDIQGDMGAAINLLDELDATVAQYHNADREPISLIENENQIDKLSPIDRANAVVDVVSFAYSGAAEISGQLSSGTTRDTMHDRIRNALLDERLEEIKELSADNMTGKTYCTGVGRGEYEIAASQLGKEPDTPNNPENVVYLVCYQLGSHTPVYASMTEPDQENESEPTETVQEEDLDIPVGEYHGYTDYQNYLDQMAYKNGGTMAENQVQITVAENGVVTGSLSIMYIGNNAIIDDCTNHWDTEIKGNFQGRLTGPNGGIEITETWINKSFSTCSGNNSYETQFPRQIEIEVFDNQMVGSADPIDDPDVDLAWTFTATRK